MPHPAPPPNSRVGHGDQARRGRGIFRPGGGLAIDMITQQARVRAPEFPEGSWFNVAGPLSLRELRGKLVLLDFWTFCCANCLHVIEELHALERDFGDELVIIGVHSPKFEHEKSDRAVAAATERYEVSHPVFNDPELQLWQQYAVRAWPTLVLIDPDGYVVAQAAGEGQTSGLALMISELIARYDEAGTLRRGDNPYRPAEPQPGDLRFPAKAIRVADTAGDRRQRTSPAGRYRPGRCHGAAPDRLRRARRRRPAAGRAERPHRAARRPGRRTRLRPGGGRHRQPPAAWRPVRRRHHRAHRRPGRRAGRHHYGDRTGAGGALTLGRGLVAGDRAGGDRRGRRAPAAGLAAADRRGRHPGRNNRGGAQGRPGGRRLAGPAVRAGGGRRPGLVRRLGELRAALPRRGGPAAHRRRRGTVRLRPPGRPGRAGPVATPVGTGGASGRLDRDRRHLQRRDPALRPGHRRGRHAGWRAGRAVRAGAGGR